MRGWIVGKLAQLREHRVETFGSHAHGYALGRPLDDDELRVLEAHHRITLPTGYRAFLRDVAASGAGPYYGLLAPESWDVALYGDIAMPDFARRECPWTPNITKSEFEAIAKTMDEPFQGAIAIANQGCAYYAMLVVTGPARGRVMYVNLDGGAPFFPDDIDFLAWYERWVDELLAGYHHDWFGFAMPGTEATFIAAATSPDAKRRLSALQAMAQLPSLTPDACAAIALRVRDDDDTVRAQALSLVKHRKLAATIEIHVRRALADRAPTVRECALQALVEANLDWRPAAVAALADPDRRVASSALRELEKVRALTADALLPLLALPATRIAAHYAARQVPSQAIFDVALAQLRDTGDDSNETLLHTLLAQVRLDAVDPARRSLVLQVIIDKLAVATGPDPKRLAIFGLGTLARYPDGAAALAALVALLAHPVPFFRYDACDALGDAGASSAIPALEAIATDDTKPRTKQQGSARSVGANALRAIAKLRST